jgi:spore coat polysaccharide biosynthesis protein SpsF
MSPKTGIILQARTGSTRLSRKVLRLLGGLPLLVHCIARLKRLGHVIVATSDLPQDNPVAKLADRERVDCFRGSEADVLDRYYQAALHFRLDNVVRATGDNPFVDVKEGRRVVAAIENDRAEYVTGLESVAGRGLPEGVGLEAFRFEALARSWQEGHDRQHREHVNEYILENPAFFRILRLKCLPGNSQPGLRLTVDTQRDFDLAARIVAAFDKPADALTTGELIEWNRQNQE